MQTESGERPAGHDLGGDAGDGQADHLGDEGHRAARPRVYFEHIDLVVLNRELDVHQAHHLQRAGELHGLPLELRDDLAVQRMGRQRAGRVARMHAGLLDVLHHAADEDVRPVGDGVDVDLDCVAQVSVEQHRALARDHHGLGDVAGELRIVMDDLHGPAAEHIGGADDERKTELACDGDRLLGRAGNAAFGLAKPQPIDQRLEPVAVLGEVDGVRRRAEDRHAAASSA